MAVIDITLLQDDVFFTTINTTLSIMTFSIMTFKNDIQHIDTQHAGFICDTQHKGHSPLQQYVLSAIMLSVTIYLLLL